MDLSEELRKYKELLDEGIITREDFDKKKRELLDASIKEKNRGNSSLSSIKSLKDSIVNRTTEELTKIKEKEVVVTVGQDSISKKTEDSEELPVESVQSGDIISDSMAKPKEKKKVPIIPIVAIGIIVVVAAIVVNMGGGKLYKNKQFVASAENVYSEYEKVAHKNLGSTITFDVSSDLGEHGYTFNYKDVVGYLIIDEKDDKASMATVAASYEPDYSSNEDDALGILTSLFLACDPSIRKADIESELTSNMKKLKNSATGTGDTQSMDLFEFKGISYIFSYTNYYSSDTDVFQLAIYEPKDE